MRRERRPRDASGWWSSYGGIQNSFTKDHYPKSSTAWTVSADQRTSRTQPSSRFVHKVKHRLPTEALHQLVVDYQPGQSTRQIMDAYGLGKGAVLRLLEDAGIQTRQQGLTPTNQVEAARLYADGWSAAKVARKMGCSPDSALTYARADGVPIRPRRGGRLPR